MSAEQVAEPAEREPVDREDGGEPEDEQRGPGDGPSQGSGCKPPCRWGCRTRRVGGRDRGGRDAAAAALRDRDGGGTAALHGRTLRGAAGLAPPAPAPAPDMPVMYDR